MAEWENEINLHHWVGGTQKHAEKKYEKSLKEIEVFKTI